MLMLALLAATAMNTNQPTAPAAAMKSIEPGDVRRTVETLAGFGTRHTLSDQKDQTRGIGAAARWLRDELTRVNPEITATLETFEQPPTARIPVPTSITNVVGVLEGSSPAAKSRRVYVVGHYDSRNGDALDGAGDAPGANDDASGVAVVLACAKAFAMIGRPEATVVFLCTSGEEQGLLGAKYHADTARAAGAEIVAVLSNDIVGDPSAPADFAATPNARTLIRVFSEGLPRNATAERLAEIRSLAGESDSPSRQLARYIADVSARESCGVGPKIVLRPDRFLRGGDHSAFNEAGYPAIRFTELDEDYSRQHQNIEVREGVRWGDLPEYVDFEYLAGVARLNAATMVHLSHAPGTPTSARILTKDLANDTTLKWSASPDADVAGYEVVWRETTEWQWTHARDVGAALEATIPLSKDDFFFGVRAYDRDGYRSVVAFPAAAKE